MQLTCVLWPPVIAASGENRQPGLKAEKEPEQQPRRLPEQGTYKGGRPGEAETDIPKSYHEPKTLGTRPKSLNPKFLHCSSQKFK